MLIPVTDAALIFFTLIVLLALCVAVAPTIIAPHELRARARPKRTPRAD